MNKKSCFSLWKYKHSHSCIFSKPTCKIFCSANFCHIRPDNLCPYRFLLRGQTGFSYFCQVFGPLIWGQRCPRVYHVRSLFLKCSYLLMELAGMRSLHLSLRHRTLEIWQSRLVLLLIAFDLTLFPVRRTLSCNQLLLV